MDQQEPDASCQERQQASTNNSNSNNISNSSSSSSGDTRNNHSSLLSQLLLEETVTFESNDHVVLRTEGCNKATSLLWRERVTQWCYDVVDHLQESRSTVYVAMNILDRYFSNCIDTAMHHESNADRSYEAAALTALFLAVRTRGGETLEVVDLVRMSRLGVTIKEIVQVGKQMTQCLSFERRLLTPADFIQQLVKYLPTAAAASVTDQAAHIQQVTKSALYYTEVCVVDSSFAGVKASEIALASMLCALDTDVSLIMEGFVRGGVNFNAEQVGRLCARLKNWNKVATVGDGPHIIPDEDDGPTLNNNDSIIAQQQHDDAPVLVSRPARTVSSEQLCTTNSNNNSIKRSYTCIALSNLVDVTTEDTTPIKRPISPTHVTDTKKRRTL